MGSLSASLTLSPTASLNTANYAISGPNAFARAGSIDVSHSQTISATIGGIPAGNGYNVSISGTATDGLTTCSGSATFSITPKATTILSIKIQCREPARTGGVQINGTVNVCPVVDAVGANPGEVMVGFASAISSAAHDSDGKPSALTYSWVASSGMLAGATTPNPTLNCTAVGASTLTLTVSDGDCTDTGAVTVICSQGPLAPAAPALVRINEVESNGGTPGDWVELINVGGTTADLSGMLFADNSTARYTIPAGTTLAPGAYLVLNELIGGVGNFTFGLGTADSARLFQPDGTTIVDSTMLDSARDGGPEPVRQRQRCFRRPADDQGRGQRLPGRGDGNGRRGGNGRRDRAAARHDGRRLARRAAAARRAAPARRAAAARRAPAASAGSRRCPGRAATRSSPSTR